MSAPAYINKAVEVTASSLRTRGVVDTDEGEILRRLLKRTLPLQLVQAELAKVEQDIITERQRAKDQRADELEREAKALRVGP